jgi:hypothetical protein
VETPDGRAYQLIMRMAERRLHERMAAYRQQVAATIEYELIMMKEERDGNDLIYQSILERI